MAAPEPKKRTYTLREVAFSKKWDCEIDDLFCFAEEGKLQICKLHSDVPSLFLSDEENNARPQNEPIPISPHKARELYKIYYGFPGEMISLVITYEEKNRFEKEEIMTGNELEKKSPQEKYPGDPLEPMLIGWREIAPTLGLKVAKIGTRGAGKKPNGMDKHIKNELFPLMRMPNNKPYTYLTQIKKYLGYNLKK